MGITIGGIGGGGGGGGSEIPPDPTLESQVSFLVNGGQVVWESGLTFRVSAAIYFINGTEYTSEEQTVTLDAADADDDRIDVIALDVNGDVVKITGTPATPAGEPSIDPETQLKLIIVTVPEDATEPVVSNTDIYLEGAEWTDSTSGAGWTLDSTNNPRTGTKDEEATNVANNAFIQWENSALIDLFIYGQLVFYIRSKATWPSQKMLRISFLADGLLKGIEVTLRDGYWGFDSSLTGVYQQVAIPITQFQVGAPVNQLRMTVRGSGASIGFYLDDIFLQAGVGNANPTPLANSEFVVASSDGSLASPIIIPGSAGDVDIAGVRGAVLSEEYDTPATGLTASAAPDALSSDTPRKSHLYVRTTDNAEYFLLRPFTPAGAFDVATEVAVGGDSASNESNIGLLMANSDNTERLLVLLSNNVSLARCEVQGHSYTGGAYTQRAAGRTIGTNWGYLRITRGAANDIKFYWSADGWGWTRMADFNFTFTPTQIGYRTNSGGVHVAEFFSDWLRVQS